MVLEGHELLVERAREHEPRAALRRIGVPEAGVALLVAAASCRARPRFDDARQVAEVVCHRRGQGQGGRRSGATLDRVAERALLSIELGIDLVGERSRLIVEAKHEGTPERAGAHG